MPARAPVLLPILRLAEPKGAAGNSNSTEKGDGISAVPYQIISAGPELAIQKGKQHIAGICSFFL